MHLAPLCKHGQQVHRRKVLLLDPLERRTERLIEAKNRSNGTKMGQTAFRQAFESTHDKEGIVLAGKQSVLGCV